MSTGQWHYFKVTLIDGSLGTPYCEWVLPGGVVPSEEEIQSQLQTTWPGCTVEAVSRATALGRGEA